MNTYIPDPWKIIENTFSPEQNKASESVFSIGNGKMGQRANFEEDFSGPSMQGHYIAGVYYPDKTKVGWWKNGYPEYFAKVINAPSWIGFHIIIDGETLDLATWKVIHFTRELDMKQGFLFRSFEAESPKGKRISVKSKRFLSLIKDELGLIQYSITAVNQDIKIEVKPYLDADVENEDSNYDEKFWIPVSSEINNNIASVIAKTKKTEFVVCTSMKNKILVNGADTKIQFTNLIQEKYIEQSTSLSITKGSTLTIEKYASVLSSLNHKSVDIQANAENQLTEAYKIGFDSLFEEHSQRWASIWEHCDIAVDGDVSAQQGIRFNIFQLNQTYTGNDERLNIGPKGFTGEKYGGVTYWDTEAYCVPFFLSTADPKIVRNLLIYRHKHLQKAIENAAKLGFNNGAALYPMVTINGEECHNEWEITFEEIHRNGAIAYAIYNYIRYTNDTNYLGEYGLDVLIGISRFWKQRISFSTDKQKFVMLGVTGPNEYENNVNNNWYTNKIAQWTLSYTLDSLNFVKETQPARFAEIAEKNNFQFETETKDWKNIVENLYLPYNEKLNVFMQQDGYMDKEQILVCDLDPKQRPINQHWSWDRILRSCYIKQADVLQGIFLFEDEYDTDTIKRNFDFYEARTVHESSLSPCIHSILAARIGNFDKAYEMYLRTARLDLDDYNHEVHDGLHITSMAGTWMSFVYGFGGLRVNNNMLSLNPIIPEKWKTYSFKIRFRNRVIKIKVSKNLIDIHIEEGEPIVILIHGNEFEVHEKLHVEHQKNS
jgi:maltose phosphorylase